MIVKYEVKNKIFHVTSDVDEANALIWYSCLLHSLIWGMYSI